MGRFAERAPVVPAVLMPQNTYERTAAKYIPVTLLSRTWQHASFQARRLCHQKIYAGLSVKAEADLADLADLKQHQLFTSEDTFFTTGHFIRKMEKHGMDGLFNDVMAEFKQHFSKKSLPRMFVGYMNILSDDKKKQKREQVNREQFVRNYFNFHLMNCYLHERDHGKIDGISKMLHILTGKASLYCLSSMTINVLLESDTSSWFDDYHNKSWCCSKKAMIIYLINDEPLGPRPVGKRYGPLAETRAVESNNLDYYFTCRKRIFNAFRTNPKLSDSFLWEQETAKKIRKILKFPPCSVLDTYNLAKFKNLQSQIYKDDLVIKVIGEPMLLADVMIAAQNDPINYKDYFDFLEAVLKTVLLVDNKVHSSQFVLDGFRPAFDRIREFMSPVCRRFFMEQLEVTEKRKEQREELEETARQERKQHVYRAHQPAVLFMAEKAAFEFMYNFVRQLEEQVSECSSSYVMVDDY